MTASDLIKVEVLKNLDTFTRTVRMQIAVGTQREITEEAFADFFPLVEQEMAEALIDSLQPLFENHFRLLKSELEAARMENREARQAIGALNRALVALTKDPDATPE